MRIDRWVLDPIRVVPALFVAQFTIWYIGMPEVPSMPGTAPRFHGSVAPLRYLAIFALLLSGLAFGGWAWRQGNRTVASTSTAIAGKLIALRPIGRLALLLTGIGEAVYIRGVLSDPGSLLRAFYLGAFASVAEDV